MDITPVRSTALPRFMLLYAAMYTAFGVASPFLPALVNARGLPAAPLGLVLSAGTAVRVLTAPLAGRLGDLIQGLRVVHRIGNCIFPIPEVPVTQG
jgi:PPP family 3-phenylpropionic acid transporter